MHINALRLSIETAEGKFGFEHKFGRNLTIVRGRNSSGKSTVINCLLYGLGMEEIIGGRGEGVLNYAVKDWFEYEGKKVAVEASEVLVELASRQDRVVTIRRAIKNSKRSPKLVEVFTGAVITGKADLINGQPTYLFDAGSAQKVEGFHRYLETFLGMRLPQVPSTSGGQVKLYLQTIFAALAVEQKRGWTDYIANIPFFGIREARARVVEYLLDLNVFELAARKSVLDAEAVAIGNEWETSIRQINQVAGAAGIVVRDVPTSPRSGFGASSPSIKRRIETGEMDIRTYMEALRVEYGVLEQKISSPSREGPDQSRATFDRLVADGSRISNLYETAVATLTFHKAALAEMQELYAATREDLAKNRTTAKLRVLGAEQELEIARDRCPTCHQSIVDSLVDAELAGPQMDLSTNILYLEKQCSMFERQVAGLSQAVAEAEHTKVELQRRLANSKEQLDAARKGVINDAQQSRVDVRRQLQIESEITQLEDAETFLAMQFVELQKLADRLRHNQEERKGLPDSSFSDADLTKISAFEKYFRANASAFEYESAEVREIEINRNALLPYLAQLELRQVRTDIKADSSASDFVRLIWSYLLALYQTSASRFTPGNHPGFLLFDEPGQHSMAASSQHALMQLLSGEAGLQSIVAASFDESEGVFREATAGVQFELVQLEGKAIKRLSA